MRSLGRSSSCRHTETAGPGSKTAPESLALRRTRRSSRASVVPAPLPLVRGTRRTSPTHSTESLSLPPRQLVIQPVLHHQPSRRVSSIAASLASPTANAVRRSISSGGGGSISGSISVGFSVGIRAVSNPTTTTTTTTTTLSIGASAASRSWRGSNQTKTRPHPPKRLVPARHSVLLPPDSACASGGGTQSTACSNNTRSHDTRTSRVPPSPLHHKHHAPCVTIKMRPSSSSVSNNSTGDKPRLPQMNSSAARSINRTPLTPKIAPKGPPVTPLVRRPHSSTPVLASFSGPKDDVSAPVNAYLANITPRSGQRQTRVDSANSTPSGTPNIDKLGHQWENNNTNRTSLGLSTPAGDLPRQSVSQIDLTTDSNDSSKFFYASDARPVQSAPPPLPRPTSLPPKPTNTFFYANGIEVEGGRNISPPSNSASTSSPSADAVQSKFFFANGAPEVPIKPNLVASVSSSAILPTSRLASSRPMISNFDPSSAGSIQRPASPVKSASTPITQTLRNNVASCTSPKRTSLVSSPPVSQQQPSLSPPQRKVSIEAPPREMSLGHRRAGSSATIEPLSLPRFALSSNPSETALHMTMASILQATEDMRGDDDSKEDDQSEAHSPIKPSQLRDPVRELVANARRERKVQDLEITNASLEAINRTLERQLRKQTTELRRYRRLSRSGAISVASSRMTSLALTEPPTDMSDVDEADEGGDETDMGQADDMDSLYDSDLSSNESMNTEDIMLPGAKVEARRRQDEKRLQLDLTKHQELLIDSQKMNQSLKRCLDFTETLIKEGQKALAYRVRVSDIRFGGRVLAPPDEDDEDVASFVEEDTTILRTDDVGLEPPWPKGSQDRDSGIELPSERR